jgi:hypothetical protein
LRPSGQIGAAGGRSHPGFDVFTRPRAKPDLSIGRYRLGQLGSYSRLDHGAETIEDFQSAGKIVAGFSAAALLLMEACLSDIGACQLVLGFDVTQYRNARFEMRYSERFRDLFRI